MFFKICLFLVCTVVVFCESSFIDTLGKCKINDSACGKELIQSVIRDISKTGYKELDIPPLDPLEIKNISTSVLNVIDVTLIDGTVKGAKDCNVNKFEFNIEDERAYLDMVCDFTIKGHYKVFSDSPLVKSFVGGDTLTGDGNGKVKIEKFHIKFDFDFYIQRRDGELYVKCKNGKLKYSYDIGKVVFFADKLFIGKEESSNLVIRILNENWRTLLSSFGKPFMDEGMDYVYVFLKKFFETVPAKNYISDDLSPYARDVE